MYGPKTFKAEKNHRSAENVQFITSLFYKINYENQFFIRVKKGCDLISENTHRLSIKYR